jgi:hypothetical protein
VQPSPDPEIEPTGRFDHRLRALDTPGRTIEAGKYPVTGGLHHDPAVPFDLIGGRTIVRVEQFAPAPVAELCGAGRGVDDIGKQDRCKHAIDLYRWCRSRPGNELLDDVKRLGFGVRDETEVPVAGQLD